MIRAAPGSISDVRRPCGPKPRRRQRQPGILGCRLCATSLIDRPSAGPRVHRSPSEATKLWRKILGQMGKRGSNLNQAARALNEINLVSQDGEGRDRLAERIEEMVELHRQAIAEHRECVAAIMRALGLRPDADHY